MTHEIQISVLGGVMVDVEFETEPADPAAGFGLPSVSNWKITGINGKPKKNTSWISARLTEADQETILNACEEYAS